MVDFLFDILMASWWMLAEMAPYLLLGFVIAGLLSAFISPQWVERHLGGSRLGQIFKASLFGVPLPLCSCGVIPVAASLRRHGAGKGATTAFLLSTPQTGVDSIAVTYALLGPFLAVFRPVAALVTGFIGGGFVHLLDRDDRVSPAAAQTAAARAGCDDSCAVPGALSADDACCDDDACAGNRGEGESRLAAALRYGLVTLPRDIGKALVLGILLSGVISALVEPAALEGVLGRGLLPILVAMAVGVPLYVCATASVPIAVAMIHAGLSPGAAIAFLISGPATNGATLTTLWRVLGWRSMVIFLVTVALGAVGSGFLVDAAVASDLVPASAIVTAADAPSAHVHHEGATVGSLLQQLSALALLVVLANALRPRRQPSTMEATTMIDEEITRLKVSGMHCNGCVQSVTRALTEVAGVREAEVRLDEGSATVRGRNVSREELEAAVRSLGFSVEG